VIKPTQELHLLALVAVATVLMWIPYMAARILTRGLVRSLGNPTDPDLKPDPVWAERARRAHANAAENLAVFAPLVLMLALLGVSTPATILAAKTYLGARVVHYIVYTAGIPVIRTLAFAAGFAATLALASAVLNQAWPSL
jgi:uncharacterized MAPEG superfamily protein